MARNDWVFVFVRVYGLVLIVQGLLTLLTRDLLLAGGELVIGIVLLLGAPSILAWLARKDSRLRGESAD